MKKKYNTPKAKQIDFCYDEQVTAGSGGGHVSGYGDPHQIGRCQQESPTSCTHFYNSSFPGMCSAGNMSLRP